MLKFMTMLMMIMIKKNLNSSILMTTVMITYNMSLQFPMNSKISYIFTSDLISFWITSMSIMVFYNLSLMKTKKNQLKEKITATMIVILMASFNSWNFLAFYMLFEMSMIMILIIIMTWSYQPERTEAMMFMIIMTLIFSLPFLMSMILIRETLNFWFIEMNKHTMIFISFMFVFMMKMPIFFFHFWLPKVHVEAPVQGSIILAAILLKLGCYGMIRMSQMTMKFKSTKPVFMSLAMLSMMILSMMCIIQTDIKTIIAYSSIVHMTLTLTNILMYKTKSIFSSMLIILGHGMCSASMFFMANMMYENSNSRSIILNKGIMNIMPSSSILWFTSCMNNAPMPPSMNMMAELLCFKNLISWSEKLFLILILIAFTSSMFSIYLFCTPAQGPISKMIIKKKLKTTKNSINMIAMITPIMMIMVKPSMMMI